MERQFFLTGRVLFFEKKDMKSHHFEHKYFLHRTIFALITYVVYICMSSHSFVYVWPEEMYLFVFWCLYFYSRCKTE